MDTLCCANDLATVGMMAESGFVSRVVVRTVMFTCLLSLFLDPSGEATDPRFEFHVFIASNQIVGNVRSDIILVPVSVLVSMFFMAVLSEPMADLAVRLAEFMADGTTVPVLPEGLLQLPMSAILLYVKPRTGFSQFQEGMTELIEINLGLDRTLLNEIFDPEEK